MRFASWPIPPRIVAESLRSAREPPLPIGALESQSPSAVGRAMAAGALPGEATATAPSWLLDEQKQVFRRALFALDECGGALIAEPTGTGKTYIALALAAAWSRRPAICIVPAAVAHQGRAAAARVKMSVTIATHERASRGSLPPSAGLAIVDESHRFRNAATRRYRTLARWLVGQHAVLLSATPAVNTLADIVAQLALVVRDDGLAAWGVRSLREVGREHALPDAMSRIVLRSTLEQRRPARRDARQAHPGGSSFATEIGDLVLSRSAPVAALVRGVLLRAAASSPAALADTLRRYRLLLLHAADAQSAGVQPARATLRAWTGAAVEQTALWPLLAQADETAELELSDTVAIGALERRARQLADNGDHRLERLQTLLADGRRTIVFTGWRETARWLRRRLGPATAWCIGTEAGVGPMRAERAEVLGMFGVYSAPGAPAVLVTTDVASEGLDLQGAERIIHFDLPWTPMRLEQRDGRAIRLGNPRPEVQVIRFEPPAELDRRIRQTAILQAKSELPLRARLADADLMRWRSLIERAATADAVPGLAALTWSERPGILAAVARRAARSSGGGEIVWIESSGNVVRDPRWLTRALEEALETNAVEPPAADERAAVISALSAWLRDLARRGASARWVCPAPDADIRALARRATLLARSAARARDAARMRLADDALRFAARGHTAGESLLATELAREPDARFVRSLGSVPRFRERAAADVMIAGAILYRSRGSPLR